MAEQRHCIVIDPHPLVRLGVREALGGDFAVHESDSREEGIAVVRDIGADVAVVDLRRRGSGSNDEPTGPEAIRTLRRAAPGLGIVAHGEAAERHLASAALGAGASAYVCRTAAAAQMREAVRSAARQESFVDPAVPPRGSRGKLTARQRQILQLLAEGESTAVAARELGLGEETVKTHTKNALARLGARNRTQAVAIALRDGLIE